MAPFDLFRATPLSQSNGILYAAYFFGTVWIGFGINAILRPKEALEFFELKYPTLTSKPSASSVEQKKTIDSLSIVYGARDIYVGMSIYIVAYLASREALGWLYIAVSLQAYIDGLICLTKVGKGQWNHWGYAPILTALGAILLGIGDRK